MRDEQENTYKKILKTTSLFGSIQLFGLFISIVRSKVLAVLIGPAGYGIFGILNTTVEMAKGLTGFSIETSGVKNISEAQLSENPSDVNKTSSLIIKIALLTGLIGVLLTALFSKYLSYLAFKNDDGILLIILVSFSILFKQITSAQSAIFQGLSKLKFLAKVNFYTNLFSLLITLPLYFFFRVNAIVPAIVLSSITGVVVSVFFYKKLNIPRYKLSLKDTLKEGKSILYFGGLLSLTAFLPGLVNYSIQIFINKYGGLTEVGIFNITLVIVNTYLGVVFTAMSTEYYPRLVSLKKDRHKETEAVNSQAVLSMLIIVPVVVFFLGFASLIVKLFFSEKFLNSLPMLSWAIIGVFFKAVSFSMGYIIIARADSKVFTKTAILFNLLYLSLCLAGYHLMGLKGIGIAMACYFLLHLICIYFLIRIRYSIYLSHEFYRIFISGLFFCALAAVFYHVLNEGFLKITLFTFLFIISAILAVFEINKKIGLKSILSGFFKKKNNDHHR